MKSASPSELFALRRDDGEREPVSDENPLAIKDVTAEPEFEQVGSETLTVSTTSVPLADIPVGAVRALIYVGTNPVRWRATPGDPTATSGMYVAAGNYIDWTDLGRSYRNLLESVEFIRDTSAGGDATVEVAYFS